MFAIMYDENRIVRITHVNEYEFRDYDHSQTFSEGKEKLIDYWNTTKHTAMRNIKEAKKLRED